MVITVKIIGMAATVTLIITINGRQTTNHDDINIIITRVIDITVTFINMINIDDDNTYD